MSVKAPRQTIDLNFFSKEVLQWLSKSFFYTIYVLFYFYFGAILWQSKTVAFEKTMNNLSEEIGFLLLLYFDRKSMTYLK